MAAAYALRLRGFTLIELMTAVVIVALIATIAYPSYENYILKSRRRAAEACLMELAQWMERYYTTNMKYSGASLPTLTCTGELARHYTFQFAQNEPTDTTFKIEAVPKGAQKSDRCRTLSIDHLGRKGSTGSGWDCW